MPRKLTPAQHPSYYLTCLISLREFILSFVILDEGLNFINCNLVASQNGKLKGQFELHVIPAPSHTHTRPTASFVPIAPTMFVTDIHKAHPTHLALHSHIP